MCDSQRLARALRKPEVRLPGMQRRDNPYTLQAPSLAGCKNQLAEVPDG